MCTTQQIKKRCLSKCHFNLCIALTHSLFAIPRKRKRLMARSSDALQRHVSGLLVGVGDEGGISDEITFPSLMRLASMIPGDTSVDTFVDIGAGRGNVLLAMWLCAQWSPRSAVGYEISDRVANIVAPSYIDFIGKKNDVAATDNVAVAYCDAMDLKALPPGSNVVYCFNVGMHPILLNHVETLVSESPDVEYVFLVATPFTFVSYPGVWVKHGTMGVSQSGSRARYTFTLFRRA